MPAMEATIEVTGLRKRFGQAQALDGMTFTVAPGQVTGFVGPNGAGKSTTMRMMVGLTRPDWPQEGAADPLALLIREATGRPLPCRDHPDVPLAPGHEDVELIGSGHPAPPLRYVGDPCPVE